MNKNAKAYYDKSVNYQPFEVNDYCFTLKHVTKHKYEHKWLGPFQIVECITPYLYRIQIDDKTQKVVNIKIMKKFCPTKYTDEMQSSTSATQAPRNRPTVITNNNADHPINLSDRSILRWKLNIAITCKKLTCAA